MAKFSNKIGYATSIETSPGVWTDQITERTYTGDVLRDSKQWKENSQANDDLTISNRISIIADPFAYEHLLAMRYVIWSGVYWKVTSMELQRPRIILSLGGAYNGIKA
jgi:hypothetical protein